MQTLEDVFIREFKSATGIVGGKNVFDVPLPSFVSNWDVSGTDVYAIKGINNEFSGLNKTLVKKLPNNIEPKRRKIDKATRSFAKDSNGKFIYESYKIPAGSICVTSSKNLNLSYKCYTNPPEGYGYIDFENKNGVVTYLYVLPKEVMYYVHQTALALSVKPLKSFNGYGYTTWNKGTIYLCVIPYSHRSKYAETKILKTGYTLNYSKEIKAISDFWESTDFIPKISLSSLSDGNNLCLKHVSVGYNDYMPVEQLPLSKREIFGETGEESE